MFEYTIKNNADEELFKELCDFLTAQIKNLEKEELLEDFDRVQIQIFKAADGIIKVYNDYEVDAVYVDSDIKLDDIIKCFNA